MAYPSEVELEFDWHLTNRCNFDCVYCHPQIKRMLNREHLTEPPAELVIRRFNDLHKVCAVHMSGGEPFLYPDFVSLCTGLIQKHYISINTNLSAPNVPEFAHKVIPSRVAFINAALHQPERERLNIEVEGFINNMLLLQEKGFNVTALYVLYPPLLDRFVDDMKRLSDSGIKSITTKVFKGVFEGRRYPEGYADVEKERILRYSGDYKFNKPYMDGQMQFTGRLCAAGQKSFKIEVAGKVHRCATVKGDYGNLYDGTFRLASAPEPCPARRVLVVSLCHRYLVNSPIIMY